MHVYIRSDYTNIPINNTTSTVTSGKGDIMLVSAMGLNTLVGQFFDFLHLGGLQLHDFSLTTHFEGLINKVDEVAQLCLDGLHLIPLGC